MRVCLFILLISPFVLNAQNLVRNPGFEELQEGQQPPVCRYIKLNKAFNRMVDSWQTFDDVTPDIIHWNDSLQEHCAYPEPFAGQQMVGFINYHPGMDSGYDYDYHEYFQGTLRAPMRVGETYRIAFWLQQSDSTAIHHLNEVLMARAKAIVPVASNNIGIRFFESAIHPDQNFRRYIEFDNMRPHLNIDEVVQTPDGEWKRYTFTFYADRPYRYFVVGNFYKDTETTAIGADDMAAIDNANIHEKKFYNKIKRIAYYCIDAFYVGPAHLPLPEVDMRQSLEKGGGFTFRNVLFESGKAVLLPVSFLELDALADYLLRHPAKTVEIAGHTDAVGDAGANRSLSERRAQAARDYLMVRGVSADQLRAVGFGETEPVADNDTPEGRRQNRRVECRLIK